MDQAPDPKVIADIRRLAAGVPGVARVEKCFVRKAGHLLFVEMHVEVDPEMTVRRSREIAHDVKDKIRETLFLSKKLRTCISFCDICEFCNLFLLTIERN